MSASIVVSSLIQVAATGPTSGDQGERVDLLIHMQDTDCIDKLYTKVSALYNCTEERF